MTLHGRGGILLSIESYDSNTASRINKEMYQTLRRCSIYHYSFKYPCFSSAQYPGLSILRCLAVRAHFSVGLPHNLARRRLSGDVITCKRMEHKLCI